MVATTENVHHPLKQAHWIAVGALALVAVATYAPQSRADIEAIAQHELDRAFIGQTENRFQGKSLAEGPSDGVIELRKRSESPEGLTDTAGQKADIAIHLAPRYQAATSQKQRIDQGATTWTLPDSAAMSLQHARTTPNTHGVITPANAMLSLQQQQELKRLLSSAGISDSATRVQQPISQLNFSGLNAGTATTLHASNPATPHTISDNQFKITIPNAQGYPIPQIELGNGVYQVDITSQHIVFGLNLPSR